ncbi:MAG: methyltransferase domain-containing protein [Rhodospirillales bacterium]
MILSVNLPRVRELARRAERALDVGGWFRPLNLATHVLDVMPFATRHRQNPLDPEDRERFTAATWTVHDACRAPWPYPDKFFDFSFCSHTIEDLRDPIAVCAELLRVSRAGYIETPSRERESFCKHRFFALKTALGRMPPVGFDHHRWLVELDGGHLRFLAKDQRLSADRRNFITRSDLGRKLTEAESGLGLFWKGAFTFEEAFLDDTAKLRAWRDSALARLRAAPRR